MKDFKEMTDDEFIQAIEFAKDEPDSRYCIFMQRTTGYRFFRGDNHVATPRYILYHRFKHYPHNLELLEQGTHPDYRRLPKPDLENASEELWESQSE